MKRLFLILFVFVSSIIVAQVTKIINVTTAGTLTTLLTSTEKSTITHLTITGQIDARDFQTMRDEMPNIEILDISAVQIVAYDAVWYINPANEIPEMAFSFLDITKEYSNLKTVSLPITATSIGRNAFNSCTGLTTINIPASVTNMSDGAFWGCTALSSLTVSAQIPLTFGLYVLPFEGVNKTTCTLYVPAGSRTAYMDANQWKGFVNIVELPLTGISNFSLSEIRTYPNPASNYLHISGVKEIMQIEIYNISGKLIKTCKLNPGLNTIDLSNFSRGVYLINRFTDGEVKVGRFVKE